MNWPGRPLATSLQTFSLGMRQLLGGTATLMLACVIALTGCMTPGEYIHNGWKVGPNYRRPSAPVATEWIDVGDTRLETDSPNLADWWNVFNDPVLDELVRAATNQNLTVREAAFRVLQARAELGMAQGRLFPQQQYAQGSLTYQKFSAANANSSFLPLSPFSNWQYGFGLAWELDVWGRYRRMIEAADTHLDSKIEDYDAILVTLVGDVAQNYVQLRIVDQQLKYIADNVTLQKETTDIAEARFAGGQASDLDVQQATSVLAQTESQTPALEIQRRQITNRLCILLGIPPQDLQQMLGNASIPSSRPEVVLGIPADLLRQRPDVRREERKAASESARIGMAEADLYPAISISGSLGYSAQEFSYLFAKDAFIGSVGPGFQWNLLNYGRILSNIERVEAGFEAQVAKYQQTVLQAGMEAENAIVEFLKSQEQAKKLQESVQAMEKAAAVATVQYKGGLVDFNRLSLIEQNLVSQQNQLAQAQGNTALGLVALYRALGGGWEIRLQPVPSLVATSQPVNEPALIELGSAELMPIPTPEPVRE